MKIPKKYYNRLSKKETKKQLKELNKSRNQYKKGKYYERKKMSSFKQKKSPHIVEFEKKYCTKINDLKSIEKVTTIPVSSLNKIIKKGKGAYYSSGSRPNQTAHSWAYARLASTLLKHNAYKVDKHIIDESGRKIKAPPKKCSMKGGSAKKKIVNCCTITNRTKQKKYKIK